MTGFEIARIPRIVGGAGTCERAGALIAEHVRPGSHVLLVADPGLAASGAIDAVREIGRAHV